MFQSARTKLTIYYTIIIMTVSLFFSLIIYQITTSEIEHKIKSVGQKLVLKDIKTLMMDQPFDYTNKKLNLSKRINEIETLLSNEISNSKKKIAYELIVLNTLILIFSATASYLLSGYTLEPINQSLKAQKQFISDASHELRTPLTALKTTIEVALRNKSVKKNKKITQLLTDNLSEVNNIIALSNSLLNLNRYYNNGSSLDFEEIELQDTINDSIKQINKQAKQKQITIKTKLTKIKLKADRSSIVELLLILLDNAVKYTQPKGQITVESLKDKNFAVIKVSDTGIGIPKKYQEKIFERFFRLDSSRTKQNETGFGLGLAIAKKITALHKGSISVISQPNQGSTFIVKLPIKPS